MVMEIYPALWLDHESIRSKGLGDPGSRVLWCSGTQGSQAGCRQIRAWPDYDLLNPKWVDDCPWEEGQNITYFRRAWGWRPKLTMQSGSLVVPGDAQSQRFAESLQPRECGPISLYLWHVSSGKEALLWRPGWLRGEEHVRHRLQTPGVWKFYVSVLFQFKVLMELIMQTQ